MKLSDKLIMLRKECGWSQEDFAEKVEVSRQAISRWENGHGYPDIALLEPLAEELEITIAELMHSKRRDDADPAPEQADEAVANTIDLTVTNRRMERKTIILIYIVSVLHYFFDNRCLNISPVCSFYLC